MFIFWIMAIFLIINFMQFSPLYLFTCDTLPDVITEIVLIPEPSAIESTSQVATPLPSPQIMRVQFHVSMYL